MYDAQVYDGAAVMRGAPGGMQHKVQDVYGSAHYVHCYAHPLKLIMQQATSHITKVGTFFQIWVDLQHFSPGHPSEQLCLVMWRHTDFLELQQ